jgi:hypothetical protein
MKVDFWTSSETVGREEAGNKETGNKISDCEQCGTIYAIGVGMDLRIKATARRADEGRDWNVALIVSEDCAGAATAFENVQQVIGLAAIKAIREAKDGTAKVRGTANG